MFIRDYKGLWKQKNKGNTMTKYNIMASQIENDTTASISILLEDETFKNLFNKELKSTKSLSDSVKKLSKYANDNLI